MKIEYQAIDFRVGALQLIEQCNAIIAEYQADTLQLTLRQLYYQLVSRDIIRNTVQEYKRLGSIVNDGRLAGLIDWDAIEDRTRRLCGLNHWETPAEIIESCAYQFRIDKWANQKTRVEVWMEKEALAGVFERVCNRLDVPYFACRGYVSQSEMWGAAMRFVNYLRGKKTVAVFHFGDHDPSGIDMTRDIQDRLRMFVAHHLADAAAQRLTITRVALNMDQVEEYEPPENPAKTTDCRFAQYAAKFGESSWELDALNPRVLVALVTQHVEKVRNKRLWTERVTVENKHRASLTVLSEHWDDVSADVRENYADEVDAEILRMNEGQDEHEDNDKV
jgi:hypothetical protein